MARQSEEDIVDLIRIVLSEHETYYNQKRIEFRRYSDAYDTEFWRNSKNRIDNDMIRVETSDCFAYVEGFIASLFSKHPAVVLAKDPAMTTGNPELAQVVANRFLFDKREHIENSSRLSLIYPSSFLKLSANDSDDMLEKVAVRAVPPWEVIVDADATSWDEQRFVAHIYYLTLPEAKAKFGNNKSWSPIPKEDYFATVEENMTVLGARQSVLPEDYLYIKIIEFYDMNYDQLYFWSPNLEDATQLLQAGVEIPIRTYDDSPLSPIVPMYYSKKPQKPLVGLSAVARLYDQFYEKNIMRTYWANSVRRNSRQAIYKKGVFDDEALAKITSGVDGAMIGVDSQSLEGLFKWVEQQPISFDFDRYLGSIERDINRGSISAPFTDGVVSGATATEIMAISQYSASEIGKMARERDAAIERIALVYLRIISDLVGGGEGQDGNEDFQEQTVTLEVDGNRRIISPKDLDAKFKIVALDQASTPLSETIKKQNLVELLPILQNLGVPMNKVKEEIIRLYDLPKSFLEDPPPPPPQEMPPQGLPQGMAEGMPPQGMPQGLPPNLGL